MTAPRPDRDALRRAAEAATPEPWTAKPPHDWDEWDDHLVYSDAHLVTPGGGEHGDDGLTHADAEFIALARNSIVALLGEADAADARLAAVEQVCQSWDVIARIGKGKSAWLYGAHADSIREAAAVPDRDRGDDDA